jgi:hypothetical protein
MVKTTLRVVGITDSEIRTLVAGETVHRCASVSGGVARVAVDRKVRSGQSEICEIVVILRRLPRDDGMT